MQLHLLQSVHQLADNSVDQPQRVVQLKHTKGVHVQLMRAAMTQIYKSPYRQKKTDKDNTHICVQGAHFVSVCVWLFRVHGVYIRPESRHRLHCQCGVIGAEVLHNNAEPSVT